MKSWRLVPWIVAAALVLLAGFLIFARKSPPKSDEERPKVFLVELKEVNKDGFKETLFVMESSGTPPPFELRENRLLLREEALRAIAAGKEKEQFHLFLDKAGMEIEKEARMFLIHQVRYEGVGREGGFARYYIFSQYPAQLKLPVYEKPPESVELGLNQSVTETFQIRLIPDEDLQLSEGGPDRIEVTFAGKKTVVLAEGDQMLSRLSHAASITQEIFAPLPKGEIREEDFHVLKEDYGKVDFQTELSLKNIGRVEIAVEKSREWKLEAE